jgi:Flp pilus assembly protein protease CpaA
MMVIIHIGLSLALLMVIYSDYRYWRVPNPLVVVIFALALLRQALAPVAADEVIFIALGSIFLLLTGVFLLRQKRASLGLGDVKLAIALIWLSSYSFLIIVWLASLSGLGHSLVENRGFKAKGAIPFAVHLSGWTLSELWFDLPGNLLISIVGLE